MSDEKSMIEDSQQKLSNREPGFFTHHSLLITHYFSRTHHFLLIPLTFLLMLFVSWRRWTSPIVDSGREMDLPLRLLNGELLYRDIHYLYPPFSQYFNALLYWVFGVHLEVLNVEGIICCAIIVWMGWWIARRILPETETILATLAIIVWCIFKPEGNLIAPYSFAALHGMMLALGTLIVTLNYGKTRRWQFVILAGILIGIAGITKQEFALTATVTWSAGLLFIHRREVKDLVIRLFVSASVALLVAVPVYAYFVMQVGWKILIEDCHLLYTGIPPSLVFYNSARSGLDHPFLSVMQMIGGVAVAAALSFFIVAVSVKNKRKSAVIFCLVSVSVMAIILQISHGRWDGSPLRALPFLLIGLSLIHFFSQDKSKPNFALFVLAIYSLTALIRVVLRVPSGGALGGYFLPTSLILIVFISMIVLPKFAAQFSDESTTDTDRNFESLWPPKSLQGRIRFGVFSLLSLWLIITIFVFGYRYRKIFPVLLSTPRGSLYVMNDNAVAMNEALDFLEKNSTANDFIAVVPEGSALGFLSQRRLNQRHQILIPDFMNASEEQRAIAKLNAVQYVLIVNRPMREFGLEAFGRDFYQAYGNYLQENFRVVKMCGTEKSEAAEIGDRQFFIKILAKK